MKKINLNFSIIAIAIVSFFLFSNLAHAATPIMTLSTGEGDNIKIDVTGDPSSSVLLSYQKNTGGSFLQYLGSTNASGNYSTTVSTAAYGILPSSAVFVQINNQKSTTVSWPYSTTSGGAIILSKTGLVTTVGQTNTLTVNNVGNNILYLLSNSNPQIANINLSGNQITVLANTYGQTVFTVCVLGTTSNCASAYLTVQNSGAQALTFSQSNLTVAYNQSATISILDGNNNTVNSNLYSILNNSNPSVVFASVSGSTINLSANNNSGTATITVCTTSMNSCGIISVTAGSISSAGITFNQTAPNILIGQTINVAISGGTNYNISSNSNTSVVNASINNSSNSLTLIGNGTGTSVITVCSSEGNCNSVTVTVSYVSSGGPLTLSQNNLWLQVGQSVSVTISGGNMPYSILNEASTNFQVTLSNNILTLLGLKAGNASMNVCSSGGACTTLSVLVNGVSTTNILTFSNNNLSLIAGNSTTVSLFGAGGYYLSNSNNQNVAAFTLSGDKVNVKGLTAGSASATICQTGGQCSVIYASVTSNTTAAASVSFSQNNPTISVGNSSNITISGGSNNSYYISSNSNSTIIQANIVSNILSLTGKNNGTSVINVCASSNNCNSIAVTVNTQSTPNTPTTGNGTNNETGNAGNNSNDELGNKISAESLIIADGNITSIISSAKVNRNTKSEIANKTKYLNSLIMGLKLTTAQINNLNYFITYGTASNVKIGASERAGILASYLLAYKKLPVTAAEWLDLYNISFNRLPSSLSASAEAQAKLEFKKVYSRNANMNNDYDKGMIIITAYGLRPQGRNLAAEKNAIKKFQSVYRHAPVSTLAWNIVRAIAYSGVTR